MTAAPIHVDITLKNYRCFSRTRPARFSINSGFTAFVGPNNSGKSSLLRLFYEFRHLFEAIRPGSDFVNNFSGSGAFNVLGLSQPRDAFCRDSDGDLEIEFSYDPANYPDIPERQVPQRLLVTVPRDSNTWSVSVFAEGEKLRTDRGVQFDANGRLAITSGPHLNLSPIFDCCRYLHKALYVGPFRNALNVPGSESYFDIPVSQAFIKSWNRYKTGPNSTQNERIVAITDSIRRIFGFDQLEINASADGDTLRLIVDGRSYQLSEIGSGLAQFILVLGSAAMERKPFILIDEPELNLHPSLQLDFLTTLASFTNVGVLFATHNIGLARAAASSVYVVHRKGGGPPTVDLIDRLPTLAEFLGELSFGGYREIGFQKILLVEGVTEVQTVQQFLRLLKKDHQVVLLPLGGSNLITGRRQTELAEITRISPDIFALIDSERTAAGAPLSTEREDFRQVCKKLNISCHVLDRRAIENYFPDRAVKASVGPASVALPSFYTPGPPPWGKTMNWRVAREMTEAELTATDLGQFLVTL